MKSFCWNDLFSFCTCINVEIESKQHNRNTFASYVWIFWCVWFCKRLKWPKGSEKGSPTELGQHIIPNFYLSVIRLITKQMNWTKINSYGKNEVCSLLLPLLPHNCQILLLEIFPWSSTEKWDTNFLFLLKSWNN